jgi:hypothetical protein
MFYVLPRPFKIFIVALAEGGRMGLVEATGKCLADVPDTEATKYGLTMPEHSCKRPGTAPVALGHQGLAIHENLNQP